MRFANVANCAPQPSLLVGSSSESEEDEDEPESRGGATECGCQDEPSEAKESGKLDVLANEEEDSDEIEEDADSGGVG